MSAATVSRPAVDTVGAPCPHAIEFGLDDNHQPRLLPCGLHGPHRRHAASFEDVDAVIGPGYVFATGRITWEVMT